VVPVFTRYLEQMGNGLGHVPAVKAEMPNPAAEATRAVLRVDLIISL
jgi:hypothetical protein